MDSQQLSLKTFYDLVEEKVSENNKIEFKKFQFIDGKITTEQKEKIEKEIADRTDNTQKEKDIVLYVPLYSKRRSAPVNFFKAEAIVFLSIL